MKRLFLLLAFFASYCHGASTDSVPDTFLIKKRSIISGARYVPVAIPTTPNPVLFGNLFDSFEQSTEETDRVVKRRRPADPEQAVYHHPVCHSAWVKETEKKFRLQQLLQYWRTRIYNFGLVDHGTISALNEMEIVFNSPEGAALACQLIVEQPRLFEIDRPWNICRYYKRFAHQEIDEDDNIIKELFAIAERNLSLEKLITSTDKTSKAQQIKELLQQGANVNQIKWKIPLLRWANNNIRLLLDYQVITERSDALHKASAVGSIDDVRALLNHGVSVDEFGWHLPYVGETPLHSACRNGRRNAVHELLNHRANVNMQSFNKSETPLHAAVKGYKKACARKDSIKKSLGFDCICRLLKRDADITIRDRDQRTAFDYLDPEDRAKVEHWMKSRLRRHRKKQMAIRGRQFICTEHPN